MECLFNARRAGIRKEVAFNKLGQHVGSNAAKFESYIGVVAREKVKITYPTWKIVPEDVKEQIWKSVTLAFNVNRTQKKGCLRSAGVKWKQYKTTLTKEYGYKRKILPNLNIPPTKSGIDEIVWRDFVISRLSTNFMVEIEELGSCSAKIQRSIHNDTPLDHTSTPVKLVGDDFDLKIVDEKIGLDNDDKLKGKSVALSLEPRTNIIAYGTIIKIYDPNELKHVDESAHFPIPNEDYLTIKDAIGSHVAWPMHLMKLHVQSARNNRKKHKIKTSSLDSLSVPSQLYMLYCYSKLQCTTSGVISIPLDNDVFGHERLLYLNFEDVDSFCRLNPISYTCIRY
ncbi:hypothetical protein ACS0TY_011157 [Phlomoides rotata]